MACPIVEAITARRPLSELLVLIGHANEEKSILPVIAAAAVTDDPAYGAAALDALLRAHFPVAGDAASRSALNNFADPLHSAARANNACAVATLLEHGAPIHALDHKGDTPLVVATMAGAAEAATLLIKAGADVNDFGLECSASLVWATLAEQALWAPLSASLHSRHPPLSILEGQQYLLVRELIDFDAPLEVMREVVTSRRYADEIAAPYEGCANMADYARTRGRDDIAGVLGDAALP